MSSSASAGGAAAAVGAFDLRPLVDDLNATRPFTPQYAYDDDDDDDVNTLSMTATGELDDAFSPTERFQLEHAAAQDEPDEDEEAAYAQQKMQHQQQQQQQQQQQESWRSDGEEEKQNNDLLQSGVLSPQDYIPKQLVGFEYGDGSWQMRRPPNPLLENEVYQRVGSNRIFACRPGVVNFAGYQVGRKYTQRVAVVNVSGTSQRLHILPPDPDSGFRITYAKKGAVAPGMAEDITVTFEPTDWRYYHGAIRLHCLGENLLLPLHAYPTLNTAQHVFPSHIDMGRCCVGGRVTRRVELVCDVPLQFEYELTVLTPSPDFSIFPLRGHVPPNGRATITLDFTPKRPVTCSVSLRVDIAQFDFQPFVCTVVGDAFVAQLDTPVVDAAHAKKVRQAQQRRERQARLAADTRQHQRAGLAKTTNTVTLPPLFGATSTTTTTTTSTASSPAAARVRSRTSIK